jgi:hypothetical protein
MKATRYAIAALAAASMFTASAASAQIANLSGAWRCVEKCRAPSAAPAVITQNGPSLSLVNEFGEPTRAWPDTFAPNARIWLDNWNVGAVYSPDGLTLQFDNGTIWQRDMGPPPTRVVRYRRAEVVR